MKRARTSTGRQRGRAHRVLTTGFAAALVFGAPADGASSDGAPGNSDALEAGFREPPQVARPQVWWHWMSGNVTAEGARLDLEWMKRIGIGGVHAFAGGRLEQPIVPHPLPFMSEGWIAAYRQAVRQARAAELDVTIAGSPGWSQTGGPWVRPADGMKKYTWSVTEISGGKPVGRIAPPPAATGPMLGAPLARSAFGDGAVPQAHGAGPVIAFRALPSEGGAGLYSSGAGPLPGLADAPADLTRVVPLALNADGTGHVDVDFTRARTISSLVLAADPLPAFEVLASDDGRTFRSLRRFAQTDAERPAAEQTIALPPTTARLFRVRFDTPRPWRVLQGLPAGSSHQRPVAGIGLRALRFEAAPRVDRFEAKAGFQSIVEADAATPAAAMRGIDPDGVIDLTGRQRADGSIDWTPPAGRWTVVRFGWSLTGQANGPAEPVATGLEVDKLDAGAVRAYVEALFALYRDKAGIPLGPDGIDGLLTDSWEAGVQNWTPAILADFRRLRGYDPAPWLPVLAGYVVGDTHRSDAFLYDFRQTLKDLVVANHYHVLADVAHRSGMTYYTEAQGDTPRAISDGLAAKAQSDIPTGEFWYRPFATDPGQPSLVADLAEAASAAHLYGKPLVAAEAMTVAAGTDPWAFSPAMLKPVADEIFAHGVNRILVHESHLQPFVDKRPGLALAIFGQFFNRNDTWAERAKPWVDYLARTSWMLQQGHPVADILYFYGEEQNLTQRYAHGFNRDVTAGYGFDYIDRDTLLAHLSVRNGRLTTDTGMTYRVLYVPPDVRRMTLPVLRRIAGLVRQGAVVVAARPDGGLGMASGDAAIREEAGRLWGDTIADGRGRGAGRLYPSLEQALAAEHVLPDVAAPAGAPLLTLHRRTDAADVYFITNRSKRTQVFPLAFRTSGRAAEWWSAETGETSPLAYRSDGEVTRIDLSMEAEGAGFVVFRHPGPAAATEGVRWRDMASREITGPWSVRFQQERGAPAEARFDRLTDWTASADPGVRYFSGAATYRHDLIVPGASLAGDTRLLLDLGSVKEIATVSINGRPIRTLWHAPFRLDVTGFVHAGHNRLEIEIVNLWPNRLIGDKQPNTIGVTYAPQSPYTESSPLMSAGLLGPVKLILQAFSAAKT